MARDSLSSGDGLTGGHGAYGSAPDVRTPALGRSSRDLASDSGPAAAPSGLFSTPDTDTETFSGAGADQDDAQPRRRKLNPDVDPDTRLGLRPATHRAVVMDQPTYPETGPRTRMATAALAGFTASTASAVALYLLSWGGVIPVPNFVAASRGLLGRHGVADHFLGALGFLAAGALLGLLFGLLVKRPTVFKGILFGLVPAVAGGLLWAALSDQPLSAGFTAPPLARALVLHVLLWGGLLGLMCARWVNPPTSADVDPG